MGGASYKVLILGGGTGGISVAARLKRGMGDSQIAVVEPSEKHYFQPFWTIAGAGLIDKILTEKDEARLIPRGVDWIPHAVTEIHPRLKTVALTNGATVHYEYLVIASGVRLAWEQIAGLNGQLGQKGICSIYDYAQIDATARQLHAFEGGTALFIMPPTPIKCAAAPQKIMYLAEELFRKKGLRKQSRILFAVAGKTMFSVPLFAKALQKIASERGIEILFSHRLASIDADSHVAVFEVSRETSGIEERRISFDFLHVVPPMQAHAFIEKSGLAHPSGDAVGWLAVDHFTLQHFAHPEIFGVGDVTGIPNSKTAAAALKQSSVVVKNLIDVMAGRKPQAKYEGYSSCPIVTQAGKVMLAEFGYEGQLLPSWPLTPDVPRRSMWFYYRYILPRSYWRLLS